MTEVAVELTTITFREPADVLAAVCENGAVLIRNGQAPTVPEFVALSEALMIPIVYHGTNTPDRDPVAGDPRTSTVSKGVGEIPLHREASYAPGCPDLLLFYCVTPPAGGGQTTLCDGVRLLRELPDRVRDFVSDLDLCWRWTAPPERWSATLGVSTKADAAIVLDRVKAALRPGEMLDTRFDGDVLHGMFRTPCLVPTRSGASFCNSLFSYHYRPPGDYFARDLFQVSLPDGSEFPPDMLAEIVRTAARLTIEVAWRPGDVVVVDNGRYLHGRRSFTDPARRILVRMGHRRGTR